MTHLTKEQFLASLASTEEFEFDWCWGPDGQHDGTPSGDREDWSDQERDYVDAVTAAQDAAAAAMEDARDCYREGDLTGTLSALQEAAAAERQFGDDPTYRPLVNYVATIVDAHEALDAWEPDAADEGEIADVFEAIFGRAPDATDDPVSDIYAAKSALDASDAERMNEVL
jgi:hypothetical protein